MATTETTKATPPATSYSIREAAKYLKVSEMYLRKKVNDGTLKTSKVQVLGDIWRHQIAQADLDAFKARTNNRSSRDDGRNKFVVYLSKTEEATVRGLLKANKLEAVDKLLLRANPSNTPKA